ncbi:hypothetical protein C8R44DRAFT_724677 [Mycena epipterygia]|nr:hypothetical protein C8R44DRAFT_724677 [Mycena epipterygia]
MLTTQQNFQGVVDIIWMIFSQAQESDYHGIAQATAKRFRGQGKNTWQVRGGAPVAASITRHAASQRITATSMRISAAPTASILPDPTTSTQPIQLSGSIVLCAKPCMILERRDRENESHWRLPNFGMPEFGNWRCECGIKRNAKMLSHAAMIANHGFGSGSRIRSSAKSYEEKLNEDARSRGSLYPGLRAFQAYIHILADNGFTHRNFGRRTKHLPVNCLFSFFGASPPNLLRLNQYRHQYIGKMNKDQFQMPVINGGRSEWWIGWGELNGVERGS